MVPNATPGGIVRRQPDLSILDTRAMPWEPHPGIPGGLSKTLSRDASGEPLILLNWMPPDLHESHEPQRHYHRSVVENGFVLAGELAMREYQDLSDTRGVPAMYREGYFFHREAGSVHGLDPVAKPAPGIGLLILEWRSGPGTYLWEESAKTETTVETLSEPIDDDRPSLEPDGRGVVIDRGGLMLLDTRTMPWEEHPGYSQMRVKVLARDSAGSPSVMIHWLPADLKVDPNRHYHRSVLERGFVLEGRWPGREYDGVDDETGQSEPVAKGFFFERQPGSVHGMDPRPQSPGVGLMILEWRSGPGNYPEPGVEDETVRIPLTDF